MNSMNPANDNSKMFDGLGRAVLLFFGVSFAAAIIVAVGMVAYGL